MINLKQYIMEHLDKQGFIDFINSLPDTPEDKNYYDNLKKSIENKNFKPLFKEYCTKKNIPNDAWYLFDDFKNRLEFIKIFLDAIQSLGVNKQPLLSIDEIFEDKNNNYSKVLNIFDKINTNVESFVNDNFDKEEFKKILIELSKFKPNGKTATGRFEYILNFFINGIVPNKKQKGDVVFNDTQIEVKFCKNSNFSSYNKTTLTNKKLNNFIDSGEKTTEQIKEFLKEYFPVTENSNDNTYKICEGIVDKFLKGEIKFNSLKECIGCLEFYQYLKYEFDNTKNKKYLILFFDTEETNENYGNYKYINVTEFLEGENENISDRVFNFCTNNIEWYIINRNSVEFKLK